MVSRTLRTCGASLVVLLAACGGKTSTTPTPVANPPQIACPADVSVRGVAGTTQPVDYPAPSVTGGAQPVNTSCTQAPGAAFPLGATTVNCTATDAASRQASCSFKVTLTGLTLGVTRFETLGDSLTEGENGTGAKPAFVDAANSYPTKLQALLDDTFPGQGITVINRGHGGDRVQKTLDELRSNLLRDRPDAVLLMTGYNDLEACSPGQAGSAACGDATQRVAIGVRDCIRQTRESPVGVKFIFVSTLTPPGTGPKRIDAGAVVETNNKIRAIVAAERGTLVDTYQSFVGREATLVSVDGLHLQPAGYQAIAEAFFAAIKATVPQTSPAGLPGAVR